MVAPGATGSSGRVEGQPCIPEQVSPVADKRSPAEDRGQHLPEDQAYSRYLIPPHIMGEARYPQISKFMLGQQPRAGHGGRGGPGRARNS